MTLTRRQFLTLMGGSAGAAILFQACGVPERELYIDSPVEMPEDLVTGLDNWYATLCRQCSTSEGVVIRVMEGRAKKVEGNVDYPLNHGKHSARCESGLQALYHPDRIRGPMLRTGSRGSGQFQEISWDEAISHMTLQLRRLVDAGEQSRVVMVTNPVSSHLGAVVDRFVTAYGGRHYGYEVLEQTNLRKAMASVFGQQTIPDFDIENADVVLSFGADFLNTWLSPVRYSWGYGEFRQGDRKRGKLIHVDSRFSMTAANADEWVYVKPGMEGLLALSIAQVVISEGALDSTIVDTLIGSRAGDLVEYAPEQTAAKIGISADRIRHIAHEFTGHGVGLAIGGGTAAAHTNGLFNMKAIYSLNYLVGSVGKRGGIVLNPTPPLGDIPSISATSSFVDMHRLTEEMRQGDVGVLITRGADPYYALPNSVGFKDAIHEVPVVFGFASIMDDTTSMADLVLPEHNYLEDWGSDVPDPGPGYEMVGFQQPVVRPFFEPRGEYLGTKGFADVLLTLAQTLGLDLRLGGGTYKEILQSGARKLYEENRGSINAPSFEVFWNGVLQRGGWWDVNARFNGSVPSVRELPEPVEPSFDTDNVTDYPFYLVPFASASMTDGRGAGLPWLQAMPDPVTTATWQTWVEINIRVAADMGINEGDVVTITSQNGSIDAIAFPHPGMPPDTLSVPIGQGHRSGGTYAAGRGSNVLSILSPSVDGESGSLAWAATRVSMKKTGDWKRLPKFENTVPSIPQDEGHHIIEIVTHDS